MPTLTTGPAALAVGADAAADWSGSASSVATATTRSTRVVVWLRILMHPPGVRNPFTGNVNHVPAGRQRFFPL